MFDDFLRFYRSLKFLYFDVCGLIKVTQIGLCREQSVDVFFGIIFTLFDTPR